MKPDSIGRYLSAILLLAVIGLAPAPGASPDNGESESGAASAQDIKRETIELLQALRSYGVEQRDEALARSRAALENLDRRIDALESKMLENWEQMDQAARDQARASLQALREQRTRVAEWYGSMKSGSASAWGHIRQGFAKAYQALHEAWEKSEREFDAGEKK